MSLLSYLALFLLLFDLHFPNFNGLGSAPFSLIISFIVIFFSFKKIKKRILFIFNEFNSIIFLYTLLLIYVFIRIMLDGAQEPSYIGSSSKSFVIMLSSLLYLIAFDSDKLFERLLNVFFFNACICLFVGTFQEFQYYVDIFKPNGGEDLIGWTPYRNAFLAGAGYFGIGAPFGLASVFFLVYMILKKEFSLISLLKLMVIIIAAVFAARAVFVCLLVALIYLVIIKRSFKSLLISVFSGVVIFWVLNLPVFEIYQIWLFELFEKGIQGSDSGNVLFATYKIPDNPITWFFGDAKYSMGNGEYYMGSDIGYIRHWFFGGLFFMLSVVFIPVLFYLKNREGFFLLVITPICLLLHFKGVFIYNNPVFTPLMIIASHILYKRKFL